MRLRQIIFPILLVGVSILLCFRNWVPGTWLSGWDTLHPEFDFSLYLKRIFFGVWQEHQGLGAVASQAQAAELPRIILYYPLSLILPNNLLRYSYFFLTIILGPLGIYFFLKKLLFKSQPWPQKEATSFSGGLLYLLNLGTLQHYYLPFEMFATHFATLGWLFLFATNYLKKGKKKDLFWFAIITFLSAPMAHTATLFYAYFLVFSLYLGVLSLFFFKFLKRFFFIILSTLILNSFWLLPNLYFIVSQGKAVTHSKIHTQFSERAILASKKAGTLENTALLKNFLFDWGEYDENQENFVYLFDEWLPHLEKTGVKAIGYTIFTLVLLGIGLSIRKKERYGLALLPVFVVSFFFIANDLVSFRSLFSFLQSKIPLFKEALRFPFTKFSILLIFSYSVYFALALNLLFKIIENRFLKNKKITPLLQTCFILVILIFYMLPAFNGRFISPSMKVNFPQEYFLVFDWFRQQNPSERVAHLPVHTFWGWVYYRWRYEGAGFWWFGLRQSFLDREFDRWSPYNENYYWEISYALYAENLALFEAVLEKYQIHWLLVDENVINPSSAKAVYFDTLQKMFEKSEKVSQEEVFSKIKIYKVKLEAPLNNFVFLAEDLPVVAPQYSWNDYDVAFLGNNHYLSLIGNSKLKTWPTNTIRNFSYYPFRSLFTGRKKEAIFEIEEKEDSFVFKKSLPENLENYHLEIPKTKEELIWINPQNLSQQKSFAPEVKFDNQEIQVIIPKVTGLFSYKSEPDQEPLPEAESCNNFKGGQINNQIIDDRFLRLKAVEANNCSASFWLENLPHKFAYLISVENRHLKGKTLLFWLENLNAERADFEVYLPENQNLTTSFFIQPPMEEDGLGYSLHFDNISVGQEETINDLGKIRLYLLPYHFLKNLVLKPKSITQPTKIYPLKASHPNPALYEVLPEFKDKSENLTLILSQAYHQGWQAYQLEKETPGFLAPIFGKKLKTHVQVNNWQNGWQLKEVSFDKNSQKLVIIFLPQFLQYFGFLLLLCGFIVFILIYYFNI